MNIKQILCIALATALTACGGGSGGGSSESKPTDSVKGEAPPSNPNTDPGTPGNGSDPGDTPTPPLTPDWSQSAGLNVVDGLDSSQPAVGIGANGLAIVAWVQSIEGGGATAHGRVRINGKLGDMQTFGSSSRKPLPGNHSSGTGTESKVAVEVNDSGNNLVVWSSTTDEELDSIEYSSFD